MLQAVMKSTEGIFDLELRRFEDRNNLAENGKALLQFKSICL